MALLDRVDDVCQLLMDRRRHRRHHHARSAHAEWPLVYTPAHRAGAPPAQRAPAGETRRIMPRTLVYGAALLAVMLIAALLWLGPAGFEGWVRAAASSLEQTPPPLPAPADPADEAQAGETSVSIAEVSEEPDVTLTAATPELFTLPPAPAVLLRRVDPVYPASARNAGVEGEVVITYALDPNGHPRDMKVVRSIPMLDQAALHALQQWRYTPPHLGSTHIYRMTAEFVLGGAAP